MMVRLCGIGTQKAAKSFDKLALAHGVKIARGEVAHVPVNKLHTYGYVVHAAVAHIAVLIDDEILRARIEYIYRNVADLKLVSLSEVAPHFGAVRGKQSRELFLTGLEIKPGIKISSYPAALRKQIFRRL